MNLFLFVPIIIALIVLHEFGHFLAAKSANIPVDEFGIGLPPRMLSLGRWRETLITINWLPLGGFVRLRGDQDTSVPGGLAQAHPLKRIFIYLAGPMTNLFLGLLLYTVIYIQAGAPLEGKVRLAKIMPDSPAAQSGLQVGDLVISVNGTEVKAPADVNNIIATSLGQPTEILYERDGDTHRLIVTPRVKPPEGEGPLGVLLRSDMRPLTLGESIPKAAHTTWRHIVTLVIWPFEMIQTQTENKAVGLSGMYEMYNEAVAMDGEAEAENLPAINVLAFWVSITMSLGILNLYPIPALDGGRILLSLPELLLRVRVPQRVEQGLNAVSFLLLIALMLLINISELV